MKVNGTLVTQTIPEYSLCSINIKSVMGVESTRANHNFHVRLLQVHLVH